MTGKIFSVVILDDDSRYLHLMRLAFASAGMVCLTATNANEAKKLIEANAPDMVLSDIHMPDVDGRKFRRMLLENEKTQEIPFIYLTNENSEKIILESMNEQVKDYIEKTTTPRVIAAKVKNILSDPLRIAAAKSLYQHKLLFFPLSYPESASFEIKQWHVQSSQALSGDFIELLNYGTEASLIIFGEIIGKHTNIKSLAANVLPLFRILLQITIGDNVSFPAPQDLLQKLNRAIFKDERFDDIILNVSVLVLHHQSGTIEYAGAGDLPLQLFDENLGTITELTNKGLPLGLDVKSEFDGKRFNLHAGQTLVLTTDGLIDAEDSSGNQFGFERMNEVIITSGSSFLLPLEQKFMSFCNNVIRDDITILVVSNKS